MWISISLCMLSLYIIITIPQWISQYILLRCLYQVLWCLSAPKLATLMYSTRSGFLPIHILMLPRTFTIIDAKSCTASASHVHALILPWGLTYPPLVHTPSIPSNTDNAGGTHDAWGYILPHILYFYLPISDLVMGSVAMQWLTNPTNHICHWEYIFKTQQWLLCHYNSSFLQSVTNPRSLVV